MLSTRGLKSVLRKLDQIECRDAILTQQADGSFIQAHWPEVDFIIGNPPFLGGKMMRRGRRLTTDKGFGLGDEYLGGALSRQFGLAASLAVK